MPNLPWKRGGSALRSSTTTYCGMLLWSREHRSSLAMYIPSIDQVPRWGSRVLAVGFAPPAHSVGLRTSAFAPALWYSVFSKLLFTVILPQWAGLRFPFPRNPRAIAKKFTSRGISAEFPRDFCAVVIVALPNSRRGNHV